MWIIKASNSSKGLGIRLIDRLSQVRERVTERERREGIRLIDRLSQVRERREREGNWGGRERREGVKLTGALRSGGGRWRGRRGEGEGEGEGYQAH